jgi:hypothetical protein
LQPGKAGPKAGATDPLIRSHPVVKGVTTSELVSTFLPASFFLTLQNPTCPSSSWHCLGQTVQVIDVNSLATSSSLARLFQRIVNPQPKSRDPFRCRSAWVRRFRPSTLTLRPFDIFRNRRNYRSRSCTKQARAGTVSHRSRSRWTAHPRPCPARLRCEQICDSSPIVHLFNHLPKSSSAIRPQ